MKHNDLHILFACSELTPWVKTGGLADVCGSLPRALQQHNVDVRVVIPGYKDVLDRIQPPAFVALLNLPLGTVTLCQSTLNGVDVLLVNHELFTNRTGNPYMSDADRPWPDNALRFALFSQAVCEIANRASETEWQPDLVHCHDWQTGLIPALLSLQIDAPATVFTIHNLAYQGNITMGEYHRLHLPEELLVQDGLEFWGQASFIKGGIAYADRINTVSPTYAEEITDREFGCGMEGLLLHRRGSLSGILNGIDLQTWNPATDQHIACNYTADTIELKAKNKIDLQKQLNLAPEPDALLFGVISRLAIQKGIDLVIEAFKKIESDTPDQNFQLALLGSGDSTLQAQLEELADAHPKRVAVVFDFDEKLSHKIEAGADVFLMPSRYEPCGLNQMYSHRYGTLPLVTRVGGLADTVNDYTDGLDSANGFVIESADATLLGSEMLNAVERFRDKAGWHQMQRNAMSADYSWAESASHYIRMYSDILEERNVI